MPTLRADREWRHWLPVPRGARFPLCAQYPELPGLWDLSLRREIIPHWTSLLRANVRFLLEVVREDGDASHGAQAAEAMEILESLLCDLEEGDAAVEVRTVHAVTLVRECLLRGHGLMDPYRGIKAREASRLLPHAHAAACEAWELGGRAGSTEALAAILGGLWAGNLFDLGSRSTQEAFREGKLDMAAAREQLRSVAEEQLARSKARELEQLVPSPRPLDSTPEGRMLFFADNAGADFLLGVLPAAVFWARRWEVCLVVNSLPASSDVTYTEARAHVALLRDVSRSPLAALIDAGRLRIVESGTGSPGIDLQRVGAALCSVAAGAAWILLEGQGRAIETNWATTFRCPVARIAVVKDTAVAGEIGVRAGSPLLKWTAPTAVEA